MSAFKYYPPPPFIPSIYSYQNVNLDENLQHNISMIFKQYTINWLQYDKSFKPVKKYLKNIKGQNGETIIRKILNLFVVRGNTNWYDLELQVELVKQFILHKLRKI